MLNPRPRAVTALPNFKLQIEFGNGELRLFDVKPLLERGVFKRLVDTQFFNTAHIAHHTVVWDDALDICPDTLYLDSQPL